MNKKYKKKWIKGLLSGEFKQGKGSLIDCNGGHCCLGVACVTYGLEPENYSIDDEEDRYTFNGYENFLPKSVQNAFELDSDDPIIYPKGSDKSYLTRLLKNKDGYSRMLAFQPDGGITLSVINDAGVSFKTIARLIDRYL